MWAGTSRPFLVLKQTLAANLYAGHLSYVYKIILQKYRSEILVGRYRNGKSSLLELPAHGEQTLICRPKALTYFS